jgi:ABC-type glycerol-3-phosphate transport system substrate-binding protein
MLKKSTLGIVAGISVSVLALSACGTPSNDSDDGVVNLSFQTLAWQPELIAANERIVKEWNEAHSDVQVELIRGDWGSVQDQLTASFEGGTAPDLFHYESEPMRDFAERGNVLDLSPYLSDEFVSDIRDSAWQTVSFDGLDGIWGVPFLQELWAVYADRNVLAEAGIELPTVDAPWSWDEYREVAKQLTIDENGDGNADRYGGGYPLANPATRILPLAAQFDGYFFEIDGDSVEGVFGAGEKELISRVNDMLNIDKSLAPELLSLSPSKSLTGFVEGNYATLIAPIYMRKSLTESAPESFDWVMLPPLRGESAAQASVTQTLSVSESTEHPEEAVEFLEFYLNADNQVDLARGDMLLPTSEAATEILTAEEGWDVVLSAIDDLELLPYQEIEGTEEWILKVASPAIEQYFAGIITMDELGEKILDDGNAILERYQR